MRGREFKIKIIKGDYSCKGRNSGHLNNLQTCSDAYSTFTLP